MRRKPMTFAERVTTPEFKADVARHAVKLEAEQAGWIVLNPQTHRALLAGAAEREVRGAYEDEIARLLRRVDTLEGRLARVLSFISWGSRATRGRVWSSRRTGGKR